MFETKYEKTSRTRAPATRHHAVVMSALSALSLFGCEAPPSASPEGPDPLPFELVSDEETGVDEALNPFAPIELVGPSQSTELFAPVEYTLTFAAEDFGGIELRANQGQLECDATVERGSVICSIASLTPGELRVEADGARVDEVWAWQVREPEGLYPRGDRFTFGLYQVNSPEAMQLVRDAGVNLVQSYSNPAYTQAQWQAWAAQAGLKTVAPIEDIEDLQDYVEQDQVAWWALPEELRYWDWDELQLMEELGEHLWAHDPAQRLVYMYLPGHIAQREVERYLPHLNVIGTGAYANGQSQPRAWIRWRVESQVRARSAMGMNEADRHILSVLECYPVSDSQPTRARDVRHDVFSALASGAEALMFYGWWYAEHHFDAEVGEAILQSATLVNGGTGLGEAVVHGHPLGDLESRVLAGPTHTSEFIPVEEHDAINFASVRTVGFDYAGSRFLIAVNSAPEPVEASISLPTGSASSWTVLGESRTLPSQGGQLLDAFEALGVHLYRAPILRG